MNRRDILKLGALTTVAPLSLLPQTGKANVVNTQLVDMGPFPPFLETTFDGRWPEDADDHHIVPYEIGASIDYKIDSNGIAVGHDNDLADWGFKAYVMAPKAKIPRKRIDAWITRSKFREHVGLFDPQQMDDTCIRLLRGAINKKIRDDSFHTLLACGCDHGQASLPTCSDANNYTLSRIIQRCSHLYRTGYEHDHSTGEHHGGHKYTWTDHRRHFITTDIFVGPELSGKWWKNTQFNKHYKQSPSDRWWIPNFPGPSRTVTIHALDGLSPGSKERGGCPIGQYTSFFTDQLNGQVGSNGTTDIPDGYSLAVFVDNYRSDLGVDMPSYKYPCDDIFSIAYRNKPYAVAENLLLEKRKGWSIRHEVAIVVRSGSRVRLCLVKL